MIEDLIKFVEYFGLHCLSESESVINYYFYPASSFDIIHFSKRHISESLFHKYSSTVELPGPRVC
jgi:hypothetical protein